MSDEWQAYTQDPRTVCKYGVKCYQKNPEHHKTFKHPPQIITKKGLASRNTRRYKPYSRDSKTANITSGDSKHIADVPTNSNEIIKEPEENKSNEVLGKVKLPENLQYYDGSDHSVLRDLFLVEMPSDFFDFYECVNRDKSAVKTLESVNLELIGPFDLLLGKLPKLDNKELFLKHWRFFYDPPEFQAILKKKGNSQYHIGYFRDDPNEKPAFVANNDSVKDCLITPMGENIFGAIYMYLQNEKKTNLFAAMACQKLMDNVKKYAVEKNYSLQPFDMKKRKAQILTNTFHKAGIVVPYNKKTQLGYRPLVENDTNLKKIFSKFKEATSQSDKDKILSDLQPVITFASIAVDECDFGTGLEVGIDLFCSGLKELEASALSSLCAVYPLLNRDAFSKIIQAHMKYRRKGPDMSLLSLCESV